MLHYELSEKIIGAAMRVLNELKPGLDEKIYENALVLELGELGLSVEQQRRFDVHYKGQSVGLLVPDLIVDGKVILRLQASNQGAGGYASRGQEHAFEVACGGVEKKLSFCRDSGD